MVVHGIVAAIMYSTMSSAPESPAPLDHQHDGFAFSRKRRRCWGNLLLETVGPYVYAASTIIALVAGLLSIGIWSVFYMVLPLAILGWLIRSKRTTSNSVLHFGHRSGADPKDGM